MKLVLQLFLSTYRIQKVPVLGIIWYKLYNYFTRNNNKPVYLRIHGFKVKQPANYRYPVVSRLESTYNNPLIECVFQAYKAHGRKINVVDVGAAIGDTVLLLKANCPDMVEKFYCIDGDEEFFSYLKQNMANFNDVTILNTMLSESHQPVNNLVRIHSGTASAQGQQLVAPITFDEAAEKMDLRELHVFKTDVDGYDGKVLSGARNVIAKHKPIVIFEWHPGLYAKTNAAFSGPFQELWNAGYNRFIWFTKTGKFSHFTLDANSLYIQEFANICINASFDSDWHYDIVALHSQSTIPTIAFANADFSKSKKSPY